VVVMNILINNPKATPYYTVYLDAGVYTQSDSSNPPTHFAILDEITDVAGTFAGTLYGDGETFTPVMTESELLTFFEPDYIAEEEGLASIYGVSIEEGVLTGEGVISEIQVKNIGVDIFIDPASDFEISIESGDIKQTTTFDTLILTLLFTDGRASKYQVEQSKNRRGWIGDLNSEIFRSKLWLKYQARETELDLNEISAYCTEALEYMKEQDVCSEINVVTTIKSGVVTAEIEIVVGNDTIKRFIPLWRNMT